MKVLICLAFLSGFVFYNASQAQEGLTQDTILQTEPPHDATNAHVIVNPTELETTRAYLSEPVKLREFNKTKWKSIIGEADYQEELVKPKEEKIISPWSGSVLRIISFVVIAALLIALIYYLTRYISIDYKIERVKLDTEDLAKPVENIEELDIAQLLAHARREGNYKLAIRLYYLGLLKQLNDQGLIVWKKDKTNRDYLAELFSTSPVFEEVKRLTRSYEAVWYGEHDLNADTFTGVAAQFESLYGRLHKKESK